METRITNQMSQSFNPIIGVVGAGPQGHKFASAGLYQSQAEKAVLFDQRSKRRGRWMLRR